MSDDPRPLDEIRERFERSEFHSRWIGMRLERLVSGEAEVSLEVETKHRNLLGTLHGGMIATLADTVTGVAMGSTLDRTLVWTTTALNVTFLAPGRTGRVLARGRVVKRGWRFGYAEADVVDDEDRLLARATATFAIMPARRDDGASTTPGPPAQ
jgi:uncharacterized protein (TIGR00369 family)